MKLYLDKPEEWDELVRRVCAAGRCGLDTEFYGLDVRKQSCIKRARIHVFSIAIPTNQRSPFGFRRARGWVLPVAALDYTPIRDIFANWNIVKYLHNQAVDQHALVNHGVILRSGVDTLNLVRWTHPHLVREPGRFRLKTLMEVLLRRAPVCAYKELVTDTREVPVIRQRKVKRNYCSCGQVGCRLRKGHTKTVRVVTITVNDTRIERFEHPLESITETHPRWQLLLKYAAEDAIAALEIAELAGAAKDPAPFPFGSNRPVYRQDVTDSAIIMEAVGIPIDLDYCKQQYLVAAADEEVDLAWLRTWYVKNGPVGPHQYATIDKIWSSPKKRLELFDWLEFPRSPVWKLGRVKRGEVKMDGVAQEWIGKHHPPARQLVDKLLHLQRVRAGKKYLQQMINSGGMAHPTCGASGDDDDRSGAITGRLGIKGELSGQQLPSREELDLYCIKKGIVA